MRFLLDTRLKKRTFLLGKDVKFPFCEQRGAKDFDDCVLQHFCGDRPISKLTHLYAAYVRRFQAETVFAMLPWLDG